MKPAEGFVRGGGAGWRGVACLSPFRNGTGGLGTRAGAGDHVGQVALPCAPEKSFLCWSRRPQGPGAAAAPRPGS